MRIAGQEIISVFQHAYPILKKNTQNRVFMQYMLNNMRVLLFGSETDNRRFVAKSIRI